MKYNIEEINQLIRNRRSVFPKQYSGKPVEREIIEQMLENANWAPTHGKTEPWRFFVFEGTAKEQLGQIHANMYKKYTPAESFMETKYEKLQANARQSSHVIAICMKRQESGKIAEIEEIEAVACAVQNMYLTATAYRVGAYWASGGMTYHAKMAGLFGLGENDKVLGFFHVGYPASTPPDGVRSPIAQKVSWIENLED